MRRNARLTLALGTLTVCGAAFAAVAGAGHNDKVLLCHGTASESNPYVLIRVDESALEGHFDDGAPGHGHNNHPDFVLLPGETSCGDEGGEGGEGGGE